MRQEVAACEKRRSCTLVIGTSWNRRPDRGSAQAGLNDIAHQGISIGDGGAMTMTSCRVRGGGRALAPVNGYGLLDRVIECIIFIDGIDPEKQLRKKLP